MSKATRIPMSVRIEKLQKYHYCAICGNDKDLELNHIDPQLPATFENLIVLCSKCHMERWHGAKAGKRHADAVRDGIKEAVSRGVKFGRPPADYENVMRLIAEHSTQFNNIYDVDYEPKTEHEIMEMAGVSKTCYFKCKRMLRDAMKFDIWPYSFDKPRKCLNRPLYDAAVKQFRGEKVAKVEQIQRNTGL